jgi:benzoate-CoA ligase family protein
MESLDPFSLPEHLNLAEFFLHAPAQMFRSKTAIIFEAQRISYGQLSDEVHRTVTLYKELGLQPEQRVLLMLPDIPQFAYAWFSAVQMGACVSAVNPGLKEDELLYYLNYTRAPLLVTDASTAQVVQNLRPRTPALTHVLVAETTAETIVEGAVNFDEERTRCEPDSRRAPTHRDSVCVWLYTSGSTGFPKAAVHQQRDFVFNSLTFAQHILDLKPDDVCLSVPRLAFGYALGTNLLFPLQRGATVILFREKATPEKIRELAAQHQATFLTAVPTVLSQMLESATGTESSFRTLRLVISAGEALPAELYQRWKQRTGIEILDGIGSAEMFHIFISNRLGDVKVGSLGQVVPGYEAKVCDDEGREVPRGEKGTLWVSGDSMALEYWQQREQSRRTFRGEWCVSADTFQQDDAGYFYFCGRGDEMLKVGGKWLSPVEIENVLLQHPAVREAAVVPYKDASGLEKPRAFVALLKSHPPTEALAEELKNHVRTHLEPNKAPRAIHFVSALPRSDRGKVLKSALANEPLPSPSFPLEP